MDKRETETGGRVDAERKLRKLTQKRLERFVTLVPKFLVNDDSDVIHDLRVASRRLQQTIRIVAPEQSKTSRRVFQILRRTRRALGPCRNHDINAAMVHRRLDETQLELLRSGWLALQSHLQENRPALLADARRRVAKHDLAKFIARAEEMLDGADFETDPTLKLRGAAQKSLTEWDAAYARAEQSRSVEHLHALRIAGKRFRYRAEILVEIGAGAFAATADDLKQLQSALGDWHDRCGFLQFVAEFIARPEYLVSHADLASALLADVEQEQKRIAEAVEAILSDAAKLRQHWKDGQVRGKPRPAKSAAQ
jgi:CHAD domain-containing protein